MATSDRWLWLCYFGLSCFGLGCAPAIAEPAPAEPAPPCTLARLLAFDPGSTVSAREALPPIEQALGAQTAQLAAVPCDDGESDEDCRRRAERTIRAEHQATETLSSEIVVAREQIRARYSVDGEEQAATFESLELLRERLATLAAEGKQVSIVAFEAVAAPDAERRALVFAAEPAREARRQTLRVRLVLAAPQQPVPTMLALQRRAARAGIQLRAVTPEDDGALDVEISCSRPAL